jgi:gamma-glutamyltranspeptidase/glutathione hydrolase
VRGLEYASKKYGKKPWAELVHPAVELAAKGFPVSYALAQSLRGASGLSGFAESKRIFLNDGKFYEAGELLVQPELARTLERVEKLGSKDFYEGETARLLAKDMAAHGGLITEADMKKYAVHERQPLTGTYPAHSIVTAPPPSSGGVGILKCSACWRHGYEAARIGLHDPLYDGGDAPFFADRSNIWAIPISSSCR